MAKEDKALDVYSPELNSSPEEKKMFVKVINNYLSKEEKQDVKEKHPDSKK